MKIIYARNKEEFYEYTQTYGKCGWIVMMK